MDNFESMSRVLMSRVLSFSFESVVIFANDVAIDRQDMKEVLWWLMTAIYLGKTPPRREFTPSILLSPALSFLYLFLLFSLCLSVPSVWCTAPWLIMILPEMSYHYLLSEERVSRLRIYEWNYVVRIWIGSFKVPELYWAKSLLYFILSFFSTCFFKKFVFPEFFFY